MNKLLSVALVFGQYTCSILGVLLTVYLFISWNQQREADPTFDGFNPWLPGLVLLILAAVFRLARKGLAATIPGEEAR
ncbi:hypothetical protein LE190_10635 [Massilia oculi]|uniref:Uncharacterized protein n=1 Tax=Massilia hydrophila TaxID=3044279 RepID=A0ABS7Y9K8_9BURK|nr:hypothetical protein [Massilia oculi]MCA1856376.1 hypothetical protein [Massilia oculi]